MEITIPKKSGADCALFSGNFFSISTVTKKMTIILLKICALDNWASVPLKQQSATDGFSGQKKMIRTQ